MLINPYQYNSEVMSCYLKKINVWIDENNIPRSFYDIELASFKKKFIQRINEYTWILSKFTDFINNYNYT